MLPSASGAVEFLGVQNASEANGTVLNGSSNLKFVPGKHPVKLKFVQDLSRIKPQLVQKVLSSIGLSDKNADFAHVNRQGGGFNGRSEASSHTETLELFPVRTGSGFCSNPRVTENKITLSFAIRKTDPDARRSDPAKAPDDQSTDQLTIFYKGVMNIYDVPAVKAQSIMKLASDNSLSNTRTSTITSSKTEQISKSLPVGLGVVRKLSLRRFLQKRKERFNSVAPYTTLKPATFFSPEIREGPTGFEPVTLPLKAENESDDEIILSLAFSE